MIHEASTAWPKVSRIQKRKKSFKVSGVGVVGGLHLNNLESRWHQTSIAKLVAKRQWIDTVPKSGEKFANLILYSEKPINQKQVRRDWESFKTDKESETFTFIIFLSLLLSTSTKTKSKARKSMQYKNFWDLTEEGCEENHPEWQLMEMSGWQLIHKPDLRPDEEQNKSHSKENNTLK